MTSGREKTADILFIGGGLQGLSTALHLAREGKTITEHEKEMAGRYASGVNAGGVRRLNRAIPEIALSLPQGYTRWCKSTRCQRLVNWDIRYFRFS